MSSNKRIGQFKLFFSAILTSTLLAPVSHAVEGETTIIGSQEAPTVLNIVPWRSKELSVDPWELKDGPSTTVLNQVLKPIDRDELLREVEYFNLLQQSEKQQ